MLLRNARQIAALKNRVANLEDKDTVFVNNRERSFLLVDTDDEKFLEELKVNGIDKGDYKYLPVFLRKDMIESIVCTIDKGAVITMASGETCKVANSFQAIADQMIGDDR